ncbi:MAG: hypothetical protein IPK83_07865 [Planctomycetes bacterium]|nr:hypothetical protein [Planctomycetota bacterium]
MNRPGGTGNADNGYNCTLDDEGTGGAIQTFVLPGDAGPVVSPPNYTPNSALSAFDTPQQERGLDAQCFRTARCGYG